MYCCCGEFVVELGFGRTGVVESGRVQLTNGVQTAITACTSRVHHHHHLQSSVRVSALARVGWTSPSIKPILSRANSSQLNYNLYSCSGNYVEYILFEICRSVANNSPTPCLLFVGTRKQ
jgi:hypothetical protein